MRRGYVKYPVKDGTKVCNKCLERKPVEAFYPERRGPTGRQRTCIDCMRVLIRGWSRERDAKHLAADPDYIKKRERRRRAKDPRAYWVQVVTAAIRGRAKRGGIPFNLTREYLDSITPDACPIFGIPFDFTGKVRGPLRNSPSVDRIIPALGYVRGNVVVVSYRANALKRDASVDELCKLADFYKHLLGLDRREVA